MPFEVSMDTRLNLPEKIVYHSVDELHLFLAPDAPSWISTDDLGALLLLCLSQGQSVARALEIVVGATKISTEKACDVMQTLLSEVLVRGFLDGKSVAIEDNAVTLHLYLTRGCNLRCPYCYMDAGRRATKELKNEQWERILREYSNAGIGHKVHFSGGEPLLNRDALSLGKLARKLGNASRLFTNGWFLPEQDTGKLSSAFEEIQVSLNGGSAAVHDRYRGSGSFSRVISGLKLLQETNIRRTIAVNAFPENIDDLVDNLVKTVVALEDPKIEVNLTYDLIPFGRARNARSDHYDSPDFTRKVNEILSTLVAAGLPRIKDQIMNYRLQNCGIGATLAVDSDGTVYPCAIPYLGVGNLTREPIGTLFEKLRSIRSSTTIEAFRSCRECDLKFICLGGCRVSHFIKRGSYFEPDCTPEKKMKKYRQMAFMLPVSMKA